MESIDAAAVGEGMSDTGETDKTLLARSRDIVARLSDEVIELKRQRDEHRRELCEMAAKSAFPSFTIRHAVCVGFARGYAKRRGWDCCPEAGDATGGE